MHAIITTAAPHYNPFDMVPLRAVWFWSNTRVVAQSVQENLPLGLTCTAVAAMEGLCVTLEAFQRRAWLNTLRP